MDNLRLGAKEAIVWTSVCVLIGVQLANTIVDTHVLFHMPISDKVIDQAEEHYFRWWDAPQSTKLVFHGVIATLVLSLCVKFAVWSDSAFFFDGGSLALVILAIASYGTVTVPHLRSLYESSYLARNETIPLPGDTLINTFKYYIMKTSINGTDDYKLTVPMSTLERKETVSVLCASNILSLMFLVGIVLFQAADIYTRQQMRDDMVKEMIKTKEQKKE